MRVEAKGRGDPGLRRIGERDLFWNGAGKAKEVAWSGPMGYFLALPGRQCAEKTPRSLKIPCSLVGPLADTS